MQIFLLIVCSHVIRTRAPFQTFSPDPPIVGRTTISTFLLSQKDKEVKQVVLNSLILIYSELIVKITIINHSKPRLCQISVRPILNFYQQKVSTDKTLLRSVYSWTRVSQEFLAHGSHLHLIT